MLTHNMGKLATEIEAKFFCDKIAMQERLVSLHANLVKPECMMLRKHFDTPDKKLHHQRAWIRLRDEGNKITLAYKQLEAHRIDGMKEVEIVVDDFDQTTQFLESVGFEFTTFHENKRESWLLNGVKVDLDSWPWLPTLIEIEAPTEDQLWSVVKELGLAQDQALFGGIEIAYMTHYHLTKEQFFQLDHLTFGTKPTLLVG